MENNNVFDQHKLHVVKGARMQKRWLYFDSETKPLIMDNIRHEMFYIGWTCLRETFCRRWGDFTDWRFWRDEQKLNKYIQDIALNGDPVYLCGHNIFFDLQACGFFEYFTKWNWQLDFVYDKGLTYILKCTNHKRTLTIVSTTNYFDQSLKKLGKLVKLKKLEVEFGKVSFRDLKIYCKRDVEILIKAMQYYMNFLIKHRLGRLCLTKSSQAFTAYRHRFMYNQIYIHAYSNAIELERNAYIGGRVECFRIGKQWGGPFVSLDFNSAYSFVMVNMQYPYKLVESGVQFDIDRYKDILKTFSVIAKIEVDTPESCYAIHYDNKIIFPVGNFECYVCSTGLKYAIEHGHIKRIIRVAIYRQADLFSKYINYFVNLKTGYSETNNLIMNKLCKYMLNCLYGKFGQKGIVRHEFDEFTGRSYFKEEVWDAVTQQFIHITKLMNKIIFQYQEEEGENAFPGLAAHVTENTRFLLWEVIKQVGKHKILYCDTDSIKIRSSDLKCLKWPIHETELGALKIEDRSNDLFIGGCKNYRTENTRKIKGIPLEAIETKPNTFEFDTIGGQDLHLKKGIIKGVMVRKTTRTLKAEYDKGIVSAEGIVTPFTFSLPGQPV